MKKLAQSETLLEGQWTDDSGSIKADETAQRIEELAAHYLKELARDDSGWFVLFRDPDDGRLWELSYPQSGVHGGGPPRLRYVSEGEARTKFDWRL